jgi:diacylglycerol kinase
MKKKEPFSFKKRGNSFQYAFEGIKAFFKEEHNARIHLAATIAVIGLAVIFNVSRMEAVALTLAVGFVWVAEIFNTAIEKMMDFISVEKNQQIKTIKDLSAAAVLIAAFIAVITGCFVFIPKL